MQVVEGCSPYLSRVLPFANPYMLCVFRLVTARALVGRLKLPVLHTFPDSTHT